jgi:5-methylcytosine-specific restriction endonuclease McrA
MDDNGGPAGGNGPLSDGVLVLNRHYAAVRVVSARRAFTLLYKESAEAIDANGGHFGNYDFAAWRDHSRERFRRTLNGERFVRTSRFPLLVPQVIRLYSYDKVPRRELKFSRRNILIRDEHRCQYCGRRFPVSKLSIDHVVPRSRGGKSTWTNAVAACRQCNERKGGRLPSEAGMKLRRDPAAPKRTPAVAGKLASSKHPLWRHFLGGNGA